MTAIHHWSTGQTSAGGVPVRSEQVRGHFNGAHAGGASGDELEVTVAEVPGDEVPVHLVPWTLRHSPLLPRTLRSRPRRPLGEPLLVHRPLRSPLLLQ